VLEYGLEKSLAGTEKYLAGSKIAKDYQK